jgi:hypothetical protein
LNSWFRPSNLGAFSPGANLLETQSRQNFQFEGGNNYMKKLERITAAIEVFFRVCEPVVLKTIVFVIFLLDALRFLRAAIH